MKKTNYSTLWRSIYDVVPYEPEKKFQEIKPEKVGILKSGSTIQLEKTEPQLILLLGASGSGKSTIATELYQKFGASIVNYDFLLYQNHFWAKSEREAHLAIVDALDEIIEIALKRSNIVVFDAILLDILYRIVAINSFRPIFSRITNILVDTSPQDILARNLSRGNNPASPSLLEEIQVAQHLKTDLECLCLGVDDAYIGTTFTFRQ